MSKRTQFLVLMVYVIIFSAVLHAERKSTISSKKVSRDPVYKKDIDFNRLPARPMANPTATVWELIIEDSVAYVVDAPFDEFGSTTELTPSGPRPGATVFAVGDVRSIDGVPVKGLYSNRPAPLFTTPNPGPETGPTIADVSRAAQIDHAFEILTDDGTPIGGFFAMGYALGRPPAPGSPPGSVAGNMAIVGGTGSFVGVKGTLTTGSPVDNLPEIRFASIRESTAVRRLNGGGTTRFIVHLIPSYSPDVVYLTDNLPAVFHSTDQRLVTADDPALPGEILTMLVRNLGPTDPGVAPGEPFTRNPVNVITSPLSVKIDGELLQVTFAGGEPGAIGIYEVEFQMPDTVPAGRANVQVFSAFIGGTPFSIFVD